MGDGPNVSHTLVRLHLQDCSLSFLHLFFCTLHSVIANTVKPNLKFAKKNENLPKTEISPISKGFLETKSSVFLSGNKPSLENEDDNAQE